MENDKIDTELEEYKNKFKKGTIVYVIKPEDTEELPRWTYDMDEYNNKMFTIKDIRRIYNNGTPAGIIVDVNEIDCYFNVKWILFMEKNNGKVKEG